MNKDSVQIVINRDASNKPFAKVFYNMESPYEMDEETGYFYIESKGNVTEHDKVVLETIITSVKNIQSEYPKNVHIDEQEMKGNN